jgi:hypothetical protein
LSFILTKEELQRYSKKFLCGLYKMTHSDVNKSVKGIDVFFKHVSSAAYERPIFGFQATNMIIQELIQKDFIIVGDIEGEVKLTLNGIAKCIEECHRW